MNQIRDQLTGNGASVHLSAGHEEICSYKLTLYEDDQVNPELYLTVHVRHGRTDQSLNTGTFQ